MPPKPPPPRGPLDAYHAKRAPERTPEPMGALAARPGLFVVQKHAASHLHWDFRLEWGGTLHSWAVPKGPSLDPKEKRLAVEVEDHPIDYADFEGVIPAGNYGAGAVIVWDAGQWIAHEDPVAGLAAGKLGFELRGLKLGGMWTLVRSKRGPKEWLLIKKPDAHASTKAPAETSILSGRLVEDMLAGRSVVPEIKAALATLEAPLRPLRAADVELMLAEVGDKPFSDPDWLFELKYDGYRLLGERSDGKARLHYRRGSEVAHLYPEIANAVAALPADCILDGELCVFDQQGRSDFHRLQQRAQLTRPADIARATVELPARLMVFDLLAFEGHDLRGLPLVERKRLLARVIPTLGRIARVDDIAEHGETLHAEVARRGWHGTIAKRADSLYRAGRQRTWLKLKLDLTGDFAVVGFSARKSDLGAIHLAAHDAGGVLTYAGSAGSGLKPSETTALRARLLARQRATPPCANPQPTQQVTWCDPELVAEVSYHEVSPLGLLRHPVFIRFRTDKAVAECELPLPRESASGPVPVNVPVPVPLPVPSPSPSPNPNPTPTPTPTPSTRTPETNRGKLFFPARPPHPPLTKGDLLDYYRAVAPLMLPFLRDRPLVLTRFPDGIDGKSFFQQDAPVFTPDWIRTIGARAEVGKPKETRHIICDDVDTLLWVANLGAIPLHVWASRATSLEHPDWCILDLDPKGAPFAHVITIARAIHALCDDIGLPTHVKTTGSSGLHVLIPTGGQFDHDQSRTLAVILSEMIAKRHAAISTTARVIADRGGRVYIDAFQNGSGKLLVAPYSVRPLPGAPVSAPILWSEVTPALDPRQFTVSNLHTHAEAIGQDPLTAILTEKPDLTGALERLLTQSR